jgi:cation diffusion facilitator CzcD-associated flavoprotein CzcO
VKKELPDVDVEKHFNPRYDPWDQRLCLVPDNDLFEAVRAGTASVVTDTIETFTEKGLKLRSGDELEADLIVTATGLKLQFAGAVKLTVDGQPVDVSKTMNYKGSMFSDVPNMVCVFGYTNASWTLKADLVAEFVCRILKHMQATGTRVCTPRKLDPELREEPFVDFSSGYVTRALAELPKQGSKFPWRLYQNYALDVAMFRLGKIDDGSLVFS